MPQEKTNIFSSFTGKYKLSKTLKFELKPLPATRKFLKIDEIEKEKLFPKDREKAKNYQDKMKLSPNAIRDQLMSDYGEKFTQGEADYAIQNLND